MTIGLKPESIIYSENISSIINSDNDRDLCAHVLCKDGNFAMIFNGELVMVSRNELFVSPYLHLVSSLQPGPCGCSVEMIIAPTKFLQNQLPANNYSIEGSISLYDNPVITLDHGEADIISTDFQSIRYRLSETTHLFYGEIIGNLCKIMMYDIFAAHSLHSSVNEPTTTSGANLISRLLELLSSGLAKEHRCVEFYAEKLNVTSKYLSNTIKRHTGQTVSELINRYALPVLADYLRNTTLTLDQICYEMKFSSVSYLSRYTRRHFAMSPTDFRSISKSNNQ